MFKCEQCKRQSEPGETQFKRRKYRILTNKEGKKCGKELCKRRKFVVAVTINMEKQ